MESEYERGKKETLKFVEDCFFTIDQELEQIGLNNDSHSVYLQWKILTGKQFNPMAG